MKIKTLSAKGLKGGDFSHDLTAVNVIVGPNFGGKTARLEAIRLALMGYLPELGKQSASTFQLARGTEMEVCATFDEGSTQKRSWTEHRGAVKAALDANGTVSVPPVLLDSNEYFSLGDKDRMRYVFGLCNCEQLDGKPVADVLISKFKSIKIDVHNEQHEAAIKELCSMIDDGDRLRHECEGPVQEWLESVVEDLRTRLKLAKANSDRMAKTVQGLTALQATEDEGAIQNLEKQLTATRAEIAETAGKLAVLVEKIRQLKAAESEAAELVRRINAAGDKSLDIAEFEKRQIEANAKRTLAGLEESNAIKAETAKAEALQIEIDAYKSETEELSGKMWHAAGVRSDLENEISRIEKESEQASIKHEADITLDCCPFCKTKKKGWQKEIVTAYEEQQRKVFEALGSLNAKLADARTAEGCLQVLTDESKAKDQAIQTKRNEQSAINCNVSRLMRAAEEARNKIIAEYDDATRRLNAARESQKDVEADKAKLAALPALLTQEEAAALVSEQSLLKSKIELLEQKVSQIDARQKAYHQAQNDEKRNAQAVLEHRGYVAQTAVCKEAVAVLEALQGELVKHAFGTILERANKVCQGILKTPLDYKDGEIGRYEGGQWISHRTFSGSEKAVAYAGISVALAWDSPIKIVLIDELSRFDDANLAGLLVRMLELTRDGKLDQFIGCAVNLPMEWPEVTRITV
jgi:exonuclease SbcC